VTYAAQGVTERTDGWTGHADLPRQGYVHERAVHSSSGDPSRLSMPCMHRPAAPFERLTLGQHESSVAPGHIQFYVEEFKCRF